MSHLMLAAGCAQLGLESEAVTALGRYRALTTLPIDMFAQKLMHDPCELSLLLNSIAAVEARSPPVSHDRD